MDFEGGEPGPPGGGGGAAWSGGRSYLAREEGGGSAGTGAGAGDGDARDEEGLDASAILEGLTEAQRQAVEHTEGPLLVLAGPGSGKTRVITRRIAYLIACGIPPWQILALTFTNKAAAEMRERVVALLGEGRMTRGLTVSTFHALCARLLRRWAGVAAEEGALGGGGLGKVDPNFVIFDDADQMALMKKTIGELDLSTQNFPPRSVLSRISSAKNELLDASGFAAQAFDFNTRAVAKIFQAYERNLRRANAVDFDDLLLLTAQMLKKSRTVREACRERWQYLLIDEYQDTNKAQFVIASLLAGEASAEHTPNLCVVGDPDQSVYAWRGADITNILDFEQHYPAATVIPLGENFRSTGHILAAADGLIRHNKFRKHKDLYTAQADGHKVEVVLCRDEHHEAQLVVDWMRELQAGGAAGGTGGTGTRGERVGGEYSWKDFAVFYRTNALSRVLEDAFRNAGVPYTIARGTAFFQREEIKHAVAYLRVLANPADSVSLARIINVPTRGIGDATWARIESAAADMGVWPLDALRAAAGGSVQAELTSRARGAVRKFVEMFDAWTGGGAFLGMDVPQTLAELVERVVRESGLEAMYKLGGGGRTETDEDRLENLAELISSAAEFEQAYEPGNDPANDLVAPGSEHAEEHGPAPATEMPPLLALLRGYLERITLIADADTVDPAQGAVTLMTLHAAKGLEFRAAALVGLEEGCLPHSRAYEDPAQMEEERRLCFVGITRAMERMLITSSRYRTIRGQRGRTMPSPFLGELPRAHVTVSDQGDEAEWDEPEERAWGRSSAGASGPARSGGGRVGGLSPGVMVRHAQFGIGIVQSVTSGANARARVRFRDVGEKTMVLEYARLEIVKRE